MGLLVLSTFLLGELPVRGGLLFSVQCAPSRAAMLILPCSHAICTCPTIGTGEGKELTVKMVVGCLMALAGFTMYRCAASNGRTTAPAGSCPVVMLLAEVLEPASILNDYQRQPSPARHLHIASLACLSPVQPHQDPQVPGEQHAALGGQPDRRQQQQQGATDEQQGIATRRLRAGIWAGWQRSSKARQRTLSCGAAGLRHAVVAVASDSCKVKMGTGTQPADAATMTRRCLAMARAWAGDLYTPSHANAECTALPCSASDLCDRQRRSRLLRD